MAGHHRSIKTGNPASKKKGLGTSKICDGGKATLNAENTSFFNLNYIYE